MGGTGSGRWTYYHDKKRTVEGCWAIGISDASRVVDPRSPEAASGYLRPTGSPTGKRMPPVHCVVEVGDDDTPRLGLSYALDGGRGFERRVEQVVPLLSTRPNFGGTRWWFSCPYVSHGGGVCGRRVGKLYLPAGGRYFACRLCLDLTYESCHRSHRQGRLCGPMSGGTPRAKEVFKRVLAMEAKEDRGGGLRAPPTLLGAFDEAFGGG